MCTSATPWCCRQADGPLVRFLNLPPGGKTAPISSLRPGSWPLTPGTGKEQTETVTAVLVHHDTNLYDLTIKTSHGTEVINATSSHLFWDPYQHQWIASNKLAKGEHLKTPGGATVTVVGGTTPKQHDGWMWDLTVPGNNDHDFYVPASDPGQPGNSHHTHYVEAGNTPVLVHNSGGCWAEMGGPGNWTAVNEGMSGRAAAFQREATGVPNGMGYVVNGVKFDGYQGGTLLDAKGPGYPKFVKNGEFVPWYNGADSLVAQAQRQLAAVGGTPID